MKSLQVIVKVTTACNLKCVYCSEGDKAELYMKQETLHKLIDDLPELADACRTKRIDILWHGGEPLMMPKKILSEAMEYAQKRLQGYDIRFLMQTNATLVTPDWIQIFQKYHVEVGVSMDGYRQLHDANRRKKDGSPSYDEVIHHIHDLQKADISVGTLMVLNTEQPVDLEQLYTCIRELHTGIKIHPVIPCGRAKENKEAELIYRNYIILLEALYEKVIEDEEPVIIDPLNELLNAILGICPVKECSFAGTCCNGLICVYTDGSVGYCGRDSIHDKFLFGNIQNASLKELYMSAQAEYIRQRQAYLQQHDCKNCADWKLCHGGCSFEAANTFHTIYHSYPSCQERRKLIHYLQTTGIQLLRQQLVKEKRKRREKIRMQKRLLEELCDEK